MAIVILGNGPASVAAVEAIRKKGYRGTITMVSPEPYPAYTPCFLADYLKGDAPEERLFIRDADFYRGLNVELLTGVSAKSVDTDHRKVTLSDGNEITYDKLLIATGAKPIVPEIDGVDGKGVYTFKGLNDAKTLIQDIKPESPVVVVGAGFIGLEVAEALKLNGAKVTVVEMKPQILPQMLEHEAASIVMEHLKKKGLTILTDTTVKSIARDTEGNISHVSTNQGETIPCQYVIFAVGVRPNIEIVKDTPIKTERGIVVNQEMMCSVEGVYAAGDVSEIEIDGKRRYNPIHPLAVLGGRVAGENMVEPGSCRVDWIPENLNVVRLFGLYVCSVGTTRASKEQKIKQNGLFKKVFLDEDSRLKGVEIVGTAERAGVYLAALQKATRISNDLLYRPRYIPPEMVV